PRRPGRERGGRDAGERTEIVLDGEIDGDAPLAAARTPAEHAGFVEASATPEALECDDDGLRSHSARQCRKPREACQTSVSACRLLRFQRDAGKIGTECFRSVTST